MVVLAFTSRDFNLSVVVCTSGPPKLGGGETLASPLSLWILIFVYLVALLYISDPLSFSLFQNYGVHY